MNLHTKRFVQSVLFSLQFVLFSFISLADCFHYSFENTQLFGFENNLWYSFSLPSKCISPTNSNLFHFAFPFQTLNLFFSILSFQFWIYSFVRSLLSSSEFIQSFILLSNSESFLNSPLSNFWIIICFFRKSWKVNNSFRKPTLIILVLGLLHAGIQTFSKRFLFELHVICSAVKRFLRC